MDESITGIFFSEIGLSIANQLIRHDKKSTVNKDTQQEISDTNAYENIMILGFTGAGKSTLINYLFGNEIVKTGTGKPVTGKAEFKKITIPSLLKKGVNINFFDSWGLEADKAEEWKNLIQEKLTAGFDFDNIIHGVIYCISYGIERIQAFDIELLKEFMENKYKVVIAFTQADSNGYNKNKTLYREIIAKELDEKYKDNYVTIDICADPKTKIGQRNRTAKFGKSELLEQIEKNIFYNFIGVSKTIWDTWEKESLKQLDEVKKNITSRIKQFDLDVYDVPSFFESVFTVKTERARQLRDILERDLNKFIKDTFESIENEMNNTVKYYEKIEGAVYKGDKSKLKHSIDLKTDVSNHGLTDGGVETALASAIFKIIPVIGFWLIFNEKDILKDELLDILKKNTDSIKEGIHKQHSDALQILNELVKNQISMQWSGENEYY